MLYKSWNDIYPLNGIIDRLHLYNIASLANYILAMLIIFAMIVFLIAIEENHYIILRRF